MTAASPITSVAPPSSSSPITSVAPQQYSYQPQQQQQQGALLARLHLDVRSERFVVDRERLMSLPESVLLCLFPNGLVLSRPAGMGVDDSEGEDVYGVDFDPRAFRFVLDFWQKATDDFYGTPSAPGGLLAAQHALVQSGAWGGDDAGAGVGGPANPLLLKQGVIVLREELEYFVIPPAGGRAKTDGEGEANGALLRLKRLAGKGLLGKRQIFTALQRNVNKENNVAEQHLIDMLCMSGFDRDDTWGHRDLEPGRCSISSIALVLLKTGIVHHGPSSASAAAKRAGGRGAGGGQGDVTLDGAQMVTAQKLLLFWRKPARKCWWDGVELDVAVDVDDDEGKAAGAGETVKVWARRVWTLELNII